jgi:hypothetical protein
MSCYATIVINICSPSKNLTYLYIHFYQKTFLEFARFSGRHSTLKCDGAVIEMEVNILFKVCCVNRL